MPDDVSQPFKGVTLRRNSAGHRVILLHYSADKEKDPDTAAGRDWVTRERNEIMADINPGKWRAEYEIDFSVAGGDLVFPMYTRDRKKIVVPSFQDSNSICYYGGLDWGIQNNTAFVIVAVDHAGKFTVVFEKTWKKSIVAQVAEEIVTHPLYDRLQWVACDPSIQSHMIPTATGHTTVAEMLASPQHVGQFTVNKLMKAHGRSDAVMINVLRNFWTMDPIRFQILETCKNLDEEIAGLEHEDTKGSDNAKETIKDRNNHSWDAVKYVVLSHPGAGMSPKPLLKKDTLGYLDAVVDAARSSAAENGTSVQDEFNNLWGIDL